MSVYAIGDIQGCYSEFRQLLDLIAFDPAQDTLWLVGDLVNRGPESLMVLRLVKALGEAAVTVLGNHDFHLLMVAAGFAKLHPQDTIGDVLSAPDRDELLHWLARRPLVVRDDERLLVHAGLPPQWTAATAVMLSHEVETALAGSGANEFLRTLYGEEPRRWDDRLEGYERLRVVVNACTRLRYCAADGTMELSEKRGPKHAPEGVTAWFLHPHRRSADVTIACGHWSALDLTLTPNMLMLDSGCLWGGALTALRFDDRRLYQVPGRAAIS